MEINSPSIAVYDAATAVIVLIGFALLCASWFFLFKKQLTPAVAIAWFFVTVLLPIVGPLAFLLYLSQRYRKTLKE
ncbi:hypothetical protein FRC0418_02115 [Corynebacterium diphtheriae]|nr:hypothetical protein FRC0263_02303 [Corynebacterium diphtheriae]CAB0918072.1 hypothetical protein FRC0418_02115 [Corynebacterium diphtheriae]CAB0971491.1 hypothetical protein FRC0448_02083 [Corynebacterium diphtheriae]CAB1047032.1 hypothetical protein FRC0549_01998 [Corynebacterium diphtheriae]